MDDGLIDNDNQRSVNRRKVLQSLAAASGIGLAGCSTDDGSGDGDGTGGGTGDSGERVPTVVVEWLAGTKQHEDMRGAIVNPAQELGIEVEYKAVEAGNQIEGTFNASYHHFTFWTQNSDPSRIDPNEMTRRFAADFAGGNGLPSPNDYMNCEYTHKAIQQQNAPTEEARRELVNQAHSIASNAAVWCPIAPTTYLSAYRPSVVDIGGTGQQGFNAVNPNGYIKSESKTGDPIIAQVDRTVVESSNHPTLNSVPDIAVWNSLPNSPLLEYNEEREIIHNLASDYETRNDGKTIEVQLKEGIEFHNGDPITGEDAKWTFEHFSKNIDLFPRFNYGEDQFESIEAPDERTVVFNFKEPSLSFIGQSLSRWGILNKDHWISAGAEDNPDGVSFTAENYVGSGPFEVKSFEPRNILHLVPTDNHPVHSPKSEWILQAFAEEGSAISSFIQNEVHVVEDITPGSEERIKQDASDDSEFVTAFGFLPRIMYPQFGFAPTKFEPFRKAWGAAIDRKQANEVALGGRSKPALFAGVFMDNHPWYPGDDNLYFYTDKPQGDVEQARQHLEEAGWSWDDDGNLRYPGDADLSPRFEGGEGGLPNYDDWPCLTSEGKYVGCENAPEEHQYSC